MPYKYNPHTGKLDYYEEPGSGGGGSNLAYVPGVSSGVITSDSGADATIPLADGTNAGLMSASEKTKLAGIATGAEVNVNADWNATSGDAQILNKPTELPSTYIRHLVKLGEGINKGQAAYVSSADGTNMIVSKASNATEATSSKTLGLIETTGITNDQVNLVTEGLLAGFDTSSATIGDSVWLGTAGNLLFGTANKPLSPAHLVFLGVVTRVHATQGEVFVKVQNGYELDELHDVLISSPTNDQVLTYESATGLWKNKTAAAVGGGSQGSLLATSAGLPYAMGTGLTTYRSAIPVASTSITSLAFSAESTYFFPVTIKEGSTIRALAFRVYTAGSGGFGTAHVQFGIYNSTLDANGKLIPSTLEVQFSKISTLSTGIKEDVLGTPHVLGTTVDNIYWIAFRNYATGSIQLNAYSTSDALSTFIGISSSTAIVKTGSFIATTAYTEPDGLPTTLPATGGVGFTQSSTVAGYTTYIPLVGIR